MIARYVLQKNVDLRQRRWSNELHTRILSSGFLNWILHEHGVLLLLDEPFERWLMRSHTTHYESCGCAESRIAELERQLAKVSRDGYVATKEIIEGYESTITEVSERVTQLEKELSDRCVEARGYAIELGQLADRMEKYHEVEMRREESSNNTILKYMCCRCHPELCSGKVENCQLCAEHTLQMGDK